MTVRENLEKVRGSLGKVAYTAVGTPVAGVRAVKERTGTITRTVKEKRSDIQADAEQEVKDWVAEGEALMDRLVDWVRSTGAATTMRSARQGAIEQFRSGVTEVASKMERALDLIEPDIALTEVRGIGPATAGTLRSKGVTGVASLLDRTATDASVRELSGETGIAAGTLADWRAQVDLTAIDGVGDSYQRALHTIGIGTLTHLANADADIIVERMKGLDRPGLPDHDPGKATVSKWIQKARRLSLKDRK